MTRRERLERKLEKRQEWAGDRARDAERLANESHRMMSVIPMGQPILVGHHSEKRDRNYRNRAWNKMGKSVEMSKLADHHASAAAGIERALDTSIFSDDSNAVEALEARIKEREAERATMREANKIVRAKPKNERTDEKVAKLVALGLDEAKAISLFTADFCGRFGYADYELSNLGGRITADKKRLEAVKARQARSAAAEAAPGGVLIKIGGEGITAWCNVTFAEKPAREILDALKAAGFSWSGGSWCGYAEKLPESVKSLAAGE